MKNLGKRRGISTINTRERRFDKFRGMDHVEKELNDNLANFITLDKLNSMKFTVRIDDF